MGGTDSQGESSQAMDKKNGREIQEQGHRIKANFGLLISDFIVSVMWTWTSPIIKIIVHKVLGLGHNEIAEAVTYAFKVISMFMFAGLGIISKGGSHNPLSALIGAISAGSNRLLFTIGARIPAQVIGSIVGVRLLIANFPDARQGSKLNVEIHHGALIEGVLAFLIAIMGMGLSKNLSGSFYRKTWISSVSKIALQILTSDLTGAFINPASAIGWAYARGDHITKEHIIVYWLAPVEATVFAVWVFKRLSKSGQDKKMEKKTKSD